MGTKQKKFLTLSPDLEALLIRKHWTPSNLTIELATDKHQISAWIDPTTWKARIQVDPGVFKRISKHELEDLMYACVEHEIGHWEYCPFDKVHWEDMLAAASNGLSRASIIDEKCVLAQRAANLVSDIIVNVSNLNEDATGRTRRGLDSFYCKEGRLAGDFSICYATFVRTQVLLSGNDLKAVRNYDRNSSKTMPLARKCCDILTCQRDLKALLDHSTWPDKVEKITYLLAQYLEALEEETSAGNSSDNNLNTGTVGPQSGLVSFEHLDGLYEQRARNLLVATKPPKNYWTVRTGLASLNDARKLNVYGTRLANEELIMHQYSTDFQVPAPQTRPTPTGTLLAVDSSASMSWQPSDFQGAYDSVITAAYALLARNTYPAGVLNFSSKTIWTGWHEDRAPLRKTLLAYQGGGTEINCNLLTRACAEAPCLFHAFLITDGEISSPESVIASMAPSVARGSKFTLIQIGSATDLSNIASRIGDVHFITDVAEINGLLLG